jgi:hypothetical protein
MTVFPYEDESTPKPVEIQAVMKSAGLAKITIDKAGKNSYSYFVIQSSLQYGV